MQWGELLSFEYGKPVKDKERWNGRYPVFGTNGQIGTTDLQPLCPHSSFIVGRKGAYRGVHYSDGPFSVIDTAFYAEIKSPNVDTKWAYYKFLTYNINSMDSGSAIPSTDRYELYRIPVELPTLAEQKKAVAVLTAIDDKIKANNKVNDNLQQQARVICDAWLREHDGEYQWVSLLDVATINPDTYSPSEKWSYVNYLDTSSVTGGVITDIQHLVADSDKIPSRARRKVQAGDIVYSTVRPNQLHYGMISKPEPNMLASTGFAVIRSRIPEVSNELIYILLTAPSFTERMQQLAEQSTSTFPSIKPSDLASLMIPVGYEGMHELTAALKAFFSAVTNTQAENKRLAEMRDVLLPKLMSGEIDVSSIELGC